MQTNEKSITGVPERRLQIGGAAKEKEENRVTGNAEPTPDVDKRDGKPSKAEILARAREAKKLKRLISEKKDELTVANADNTSKPDVVPDDGYNTGDDTDDDGDEHVLASALPKLSAYTRKRIFKAISGGNRDEDTGEEPPRKKHKPATKDTNVGAVGGFLVDKTIDLVRLAAASGVASIGIVLLKSLASGQTSTPVTPAGEISSDWIKQ